MLEQAALRGEPGARAALANRLMSGNAVGTSAHERGLALLHDAAADKDGAEAQWLLGAYFLQVSSRGRSHAMAQEWLARAASAGIAPAIDRLADLHLSGLGGVHSVREALALQLRLADQGYQRAAWEAGFLLTLPDAGSELEAASLFLRACALGYPPAYYSLGLRFGTGSGVVRDEPFAHALLRRAADAGFAGATEAIEEMFPDAGRGAEVEHWYGKLKTNLHAAHPLLERLRPGYAGEGSPVHPLVQQLESHLVEVGHPAIRLDAGRRASVVSGADARTDAVHQWNWLSDRPRVGICRGYATREECAHLINKVAAAMRPATDYRRGNSANEDAELASFSGRGHPVAPLHTDAVTRTLERRISAMAEWPMEKLEPCSIVCYRPGEEYRPHVDYFTDDQIMMNEQARRDYGAQRVATFLLYLRAPEAGGETCYEHAGVQVAGERGMGIIHYNVTPDGSQDPESVHSGKPILSGEKWLWRSTLRQRSLYHPEENGLQTSDPIRSVETP